MGWRFRKVFQSGPFRWTWTGKGVGWSCGIPGLRYGVSSDGKRYVSVGLPGTGLSYIKYLDKEESDPSAGVPSTSQTPLLQQTQTPPKPAGPWWKQKHLLD